MREEIVTKLRNVLEGFWLVPGAVAVLVAATAVLLVEIDESSAGSAGLFPGDAQAARVVLSVVAGSLITVAGLTFSITILTLQLVSSQFTPRALRSLFSDTTNQIVAGAFIGIFGYCLLVLRSISDDGVPRLAITGAIALGLVGLGLLLLFIHHVGRSIKVDEICARIAQDTLKATDQRYPEHFGKPGPEALTPHGPSALIYADRPGWVRAVLVDKLADRLPAAESAEVLVVPGDFVTPAHPIVAVRPPAAADEGAAGAFEIGRERNLNQDVGFGIRLLVDIALRALSPGVNDPTTAVTCIGYLEAILERLAARMSPDPHRRVGDRRLLVSVPSRSFERLLEEGFLEIGRHGRDDSRTIAAVLRALARIGGVAASVGADDRVASVRAVAMEVAAPAIAHAQTEEESATLERLTDRATGLNLRNVATARQGRVASVDV